MSGVGDIFAGIFGAGAATASLSAQADAWAFNTKALNQAANQEDFSAVDTLMQGAQQGGFTRMAASAAAAREQVAYASAGVVPSVGTAARVQTATMNQGELAARVAENNAARAALGHRQTANRFRTQIEMENRQLENAKNAATLEYAGSGAKVLEGFISLAMMGGAGG